MPHPSKVSSMSPPPTQPSSPPSQKKCPPPPANIYSNNYNDSSNMFAALAHVLVVWKSSVYKLIWQDALFFTVGYALLSLLYRLVLMRYPPLREAFEIACVYANRFSGLIPIAFLTGFYVSQVITRWWDQFMSLPWPEKMAYKMVAFVPGKDPYNTQLRRTVMRYVNLSTLLSYRMVSTKVQERFPTYESLVEFNVILPGEVARLRRADHLAPFESANMPVLWAVKLLERARTEGRIEMEGPVYAAMIGSFDYIQDCNRKMLNYGWMNFPLAYTQVATLSILVYFLAALLGRQYLTPREEEQDDTTFPHLNITYSTTEPFKAHTPDFYVPFFTFVEFLCYMGWIKVADALLNPFGDDDQDFKVNFLIDRNLYVSYLMVDEKEEDEDNEEENENEEETLSSTDPPPAYDSRGIRIGMKLVNRSGLSSTSASSSAASPPSSSGVVSNSLNVPNDVVGSYVDEMVSRKVGRK